MKPIGTGDSSMLAKMLQEHRLTTAEIFYFFPDHPSLLQSYIWQELDKPPLFPELRRFLTFWEHKIEGKLHSVEVTSAELIKPAAISLVDGLYVINPIQHH